MTNKRNRVIAFLLAASLFMNTAVLPARAEEVTPPTEYPEITEPAPTQEPAPAATEAPTEAPTQAPTQAPTEETPGTEAATEAPTEETQAPTQETEGPTEETQEVTQPTEETQEPTEETQEATEPTEETQEATEPTEETTVPDEEALWAAQEAGYLLGIRHYSTLPVTGERNMPLEWWYVLTGQAAMREPDPDTMPEETEPAEDPETTQDWGRYLVFPESIVVHSARELTLLSYVWPGEYHQRTITLLADAGAEFDLTAPAAIHQGTEAEQALGFQGLGGLDYPFGGTLRFGVQSGDIYFVLSSPLFNGILCQARFVDAENQPNPIRLMSKAEYSFDGLLAVHVLGEETAPAYWNVQLLAPDTENGGQFCLPSLLGILYAGANMNLSLTDMSRLAPAARGYLCAVMYRHAALRATNITREISVPLVGQLDAEATLITDAPSAQPTEAPTEEATEAPTEEATEAPTEEATEAPTEAPTEEATEAPTEEATEAPTEEATEAPTEAPTEEATQPESVPDGAALLEMAIAFYQAMEVVPGEMSLEWWYAVTGQALPGTVQAELVVNGEEFLRYLEENQIPMPTLPTESLPEEPTAPQEDTAPTQEATLPQETALPEETSGPEETAPGEEAAAPAGNNISDEIINEELTSFPEAGAIALAWEGDTASVHSDDADSTQGMYAVAAYGALEDAGFPESGDTISIGSTRALIQLSYVDAGAYQSKNLVLLWNAGDNAVFKTDTPDGESAFQGLGSEAAPFRGTIGMQTGSENVPIQLARPLFNAVADSAEIGNLNLKSAVTGTADGLLAKVVTAGNGTKTWAVTLVPHVDTEDTGKIYVLPALLGTMRSGSNVTLQVTDEAGLTVSGSGYLCAAMGSGARLTVESLGSIPAVINAADAAVGGLVGTMGSGASLAVGSLDGCIIDVTSNYSPADKAPNGAAGGLVGKMEDGAALTVSSAVTIGSITGKGYTGGIAGECTNPVFTFSDDASLTGANNLGQIYSSGGRAVGGIAGNLTWSSDNPDMAALPISSLLITNGDAGGLYGEVNASKALVFSYNGSLFTNVTLNSRNLKDSGDEGAGALGGLIGWFHGTYGNITVEAGTVIEVTMGHGSYIGGLIGAHDCDQAAIITLSGQITLHGSDTSVNVGGVIGGSSKKEMRVACSNLTVSIDGFDKFAPTGNYGGLIGKIANPSYVYVGENVDLSGTKIIGTGVAGGLIGTLDSGVLYLGDNPVLPTESSASNVNQRGWIVGNRGNALVCAAKNWAPSHNADYQMNDTNPWGQVLQLKKFDSSLIQLDTESRTVTVGSLPAMSGNSYVIGSLTDFAAVALRMQLNPTGALKIGGDFGNNSTVSLTLNADIDLNGTDLNGTGLTGLTRDISTTDAFSVTLDGGGHTITLPGEQVYASGNSHNRLGLIGMVEALNLSDLSIAGKCQTTVLSGGQIYTGIACEAAQNAKLEKVISGFTWTIDGNSGNSRHSGMVTQLSGKGTNVTYTNCTWNGTITDNTSANSEIAGFLAHLETEGNEITVKDCTLRGTIQRPAFTGQAQVGGLVACLNGSNTTLTIDGLTVSTHITVKAPQNGWADSGGLLGYGWKKTTATFTDVTITDSTLDTDRKFGGLVYKGSGYWKLTEGNGITFTGSNQFTGTSDNGTPSALLVSTSYETGLYLEVLRNSFVYNENTVLVDVGGTDQYFDALMGKSIYGDGQDSIVSIATASSSDSTPHKIDLESCNTYRTFLSNTYANPCTRYDYNLDSFNRGEAADAIDTPEEMVLWSVYRRCHSDLKNYFKRGSGTKITGNIDLTGYAFYPAPYDGTYLENATITFAFQQLEEVERAASNKKPSDSLRQHAGMHTGIFTGVGGNGTLSVTNLTLSGTVGGYNGSYGAIIRGSAQGADKDNLRTLAIHGVTLDGIQIYPEVTGDTVAPLLIGSLGSFTTLNLSGVTVNPGSYTPGTKAASSLIGSAGNDSADYIQLTFGNMRLSETGVKNSPSTLFTRGLFLETFRYSGNNCRGVYNFERDDDYTLGREISNTEGGPVSGRNNGEQYWFFRENGKETGYVCTAIGENNSSTAFQEYPRYVAQPEAQPEGGNAATYHEIDVNLVSPDLLIGCGTYSHPYLITNGRQLEALSQAILAGGSRRDWQVKVSNPVMANKQDFSQQDGHTGTGSDEEEDVLEGETVYVSSSQDWTGLGVASTCKDSAMLKYLCNAYYQIVGEIALSTWSGLGESGTDKQFSGVLVGKNDAKVILSGTRTAAQFGGLVKFSRGCVVKDLAIVYQNDCTITLQCDNVPSGLANASFFGGVVGWCVGGDTVIDNVSVTYNGTVAPAGDKAHLAAFGGYVGLVGGANDQAGGGVIFRNISGGTTGFTPNYGYYSNPYIGRVLDGFALSENSWLGEPTDNYRIPQITAARISTNGSQVTVSDAAGLWVLSAWVNSRGGSAGKPRAGNYSQIGTRVSREFLTDEASGSTPYLARTFKCAYSGPLCLTLEADCDMSPYGNGFRGIGASCGNNHPKLELSSLEGGGHTVTLQQDIWQYLDERDNWLFVSGGLFPDPVFSAPSTTVSNLTVSGKMHLYYTDAAQKIVNSWDAGQAGAGLLIGKSLDAKNSLELTNVRAKNAKVMSNAQYVGGLIGRLQSWGGHNLTIQTCGYEAVTVSGYQNVGGLIGGYDGNFDGSSATIQGISCSGGKILVPEEYGRSMNNSDLFGTGGLVGYLSAGVSTICGVTLNGENEIHNDGIYTSVEAGIGALVGLWCPRSIATAQDITITDTFTITGNNRSSIGCLGGYVCRPDDLNNWGTNTSGIQFTASDIHIGQDEGSKVSITGNQVGGLVGLYKSGAQGTNRFTMKQIHQRNITLTSNTADGSVGSLVGILCKAPAVIASDIFLSDNRITGSGSVALLFARSHNQVGNTQLTIDVKNVEATGCEVTGTGSNAGFLYGNHDGGNGKGAINGYNILISGSSINGTAIWGGGNAKNTPVRLVAVCLQNCNAPAKDFAAGDSCYAIRANYTGAKQEVGSAPYIPGNPQSPLVSLDTSSITGDGASWADAEKKVPMGKKIRDGVATGNCNTYFNAQEEAQYFASNDFISHYADGGDNGALSSGQVNFPVLVVPADTRQEVTKEISNYITLLTNEKNWRRVVSGVTIHTYQWKGSGFEMLTDTSLSWNGNEQQFAVAKGCHDNQRNQFTMLDVQFTAGSENCYHLYIPVIVRKELEFRFWVAAEVGTDYYVSAYDSLFTPAIGSHGEPVTALIGFEYLRSKEEWQAAVDNGENLLWSFVKELTLNPVSGATALPEGTKLALVERGNANKAYFCQESFGTSLPFVSFDGWAGAQHPCLCDGLKLTAQESETGLYVKTQPENATLRIGEEYYKIPEGTETGTDGKTYAITVQATENLREEYYLTILTPDNSPITNFTITQSSKLQGNLPTKLVKNEGGTEFTRKNAENQIILANFFTQTVSVTTTNSDPLMSGSNNTIGATLKATIGFANDKAAQLFRDYGSSKQLHQRFDLVLKLCQGTSEAQTSLASGTTLQVTYRKNGTDISTATVPVSGSAAKLTFPGDGIQVSELTGDLTLEAQVLLTYTDPGILQQFPTRDSNDTTTGILVCANSYLAYSAPSLAQSSSPKSADDSNKRRYYRQETGATSLHYVATGSNRLNQLGINALESGEAAAIDSSAQYVLSSLNAATQAATLHCTVTLQRKTDDGRSYQDTTVPFQAAIGATVVGSDGRTQDFPAQNGNIADFTLSNGIDNSIPIQIPVTLHIGTGSALESAGGYYANYRVVLTAQLLNRSGTPIPNSQASDYIVYTNAKIVTELIR